jgi:predicted small lipoprotein YifL
MTGPSPVRPTGLLAVLAVLAACGADGPPSAPAAASDAAPQPGITLTGEAQLGVVVVNPGFLE